MSKLWRYGDTHKEGKYLVVRRDGSVPEFPVFVLGARDPAASEALRTYARIASVHHLDSAYVDDIMRLADDFMKYRLEHGEGNPDASPHRIDDPMIVRAMQSLGATISLSSISTIR